MEEKWFLVKGMFEQTKAVQVGEKRRDSCCSSTFKTQNHMLSLPNTYKDKQKALSIMEKGWGLSPPLWPSLH